jgi:hypothetical protein
MEPMEEFSCFMWIALNDIPQWSTAELSLKFLIKKKSISNDDITYSDQFTNLKKFLTGCKDNEEFCIILAHQKWMKYFENSKNVDEQSELLKIAKFFTILSHKAQASRIFSVMQVQWTVDSANLNTESFKGILLVQCKYKNLSRKELHGYLMNNRHLLTNIRSTQKYAGAQQELELP